MIGNMPSVSRRLARWSRLASLGATLGIGLAAGSAWSNDSIAELETGGLTLSRTDDIEMRSEDLYVSKDEIRVTYRFFNVSGQDKDAIVAFPMPDLDFSTDLMVGIPRPGEENFLGFSTKVDGKPVPTEVEVKALGSNGADQTAILRRLGVPLYPSEDDKTLAAVPRAEWDELVRLGLVEIQSSYDTKTGKDVEYLRPAWVLKTTYHFKQVFPAGREVTIEHRYQPSTGGSSPPVVVDDDLAKVDRPDYLAEYVKAYCIDPPFIDAVQKIKREAKADSMPLSDHQVSYILKTGANWAGPIKDFRLVIDKGAAANLVSFCGDGVKKISPTQFEIRRTNFTPAADLHILFVERENG